MPIALLVLGLAGQTAQPAPVTQAPHVSPNITKARPTARVLRTPTGNSAIDARLAKMLVVQPPCENGTDAVEAAAAEIKNNPSKYLNPDGSVNVIALTKLIEEKQAEQKAKPC